MIHFTKYWTLLLALCFLNISHAQLFTEVSDEVGLDYVYPGNDFQMVGGGVMVIDVNNDGWEDFYQSGGVFDSKLWLNNQGEFIDGTAQYGLDLLSGYFIQGTISADYDNDGFQDFIVVNYGTGMSRGDKSSPVLVHNIDGKSFELIKLDEFLEPGNFSSACWGDINNDGFVDLYLTNYVATMGELIDSNDNVIGYDPFCYENKLLINVEGKSFRESSTEYRVNNGGCGLAASFTDVDGDGDQDLLLLNDFGEWTGEGNKYFRNDFPSKQFTDVSSESGFSRSMYGMGIGQGDYDEDGDIDYYVTNIGQNCLFQNSNGVFNEVARELNIDLTYVHDSIRGTSWSGLFFDLEFDGDLDLFVSKGNVATLIPKTVLSDPNKIFINNDGTFTDVTQESGLDDILSHRGSAIFDYDHDGDLDIVSSVVKLPWSVFSRKEQKIKLYRNDTKAKNWIGVKLIGENGINRDGFGCKILFEEGTRKMMREVDAGSGQASQSSRIIYYGLNKCKKLTKATIYWMDGSTTMVKNLKQGFVYEVRPKGQVRRIKH